MLLSMTTIFILAVLGMKHPLIGLKENYKQIASEGMILFTIDLLLFSSDPAIDPDDRPYIGWSMIVLVGSYLLLSQGSLLYSAVRNFIMKFKRY